MNVDPVQDTPQDLSMKTARKAKQKPIPPPLDLNARTLTTADSPDISGNAATDLRVPKSPGDLPRECLPIRKRPLLEVRRDLHGSKSPKSAGPNGLAPCQPFSIDFRHVNTAPSSPHRYPPLSVNSTMSLTPSSANSLASSVNSAFTHFPVPPPLIHSSKSPFLAVAAAAAAAHAANSSNGYPTPPTDLPCSPYPWPSPHHHAMFPSPFSPVLPHSPLHFPTTALLSPAPSSYPSSTNSSREELPVGASIATSGGGSNGNGPGQQQQHERDLSDAKRRYMSNNAADSTSPVPSSPLLSPRTWSHSWPTPSWQCFVQGTMIKFLIPDLETPWQKAEDLGWKDRLAMKVDAMNKYQYAPNGLTIVKIDVISRDSNSTKDSSGSAFSSDLAFKFGSNSEKSAQTFMLLRLAPHKGDNSTEILAECSIDHPFYVKEKGWCSIQPRLSIEKYGIPCQELSVGDICLPPNHPEAVRTPDLCDRFRRFEFEDPLSPLAQSGGGVKRELLAVSSAAASAVSNTTVSSSGNRKGQHTMSPPHSPAKKKEKDPDKPKRPMNGFMLFAKKFRLELIQQHPGKDNRAISVLLGEAWKSQPQEEREQYSQAAKLMADEQKKLFPDCWKRKRTVNAGTPPASQQQQNTNPLNSPPPVQAQSHQQPQQQQNRILTNSGYGAFTPITSLHQHLPHLAHGRQQQTQQIPPHPTGATI